jgi:hypothetical protein
MPGFLNRIVSFANVYIQLKILVVLESSFVKQAPGVPRYKAQNSN